MFPPAYAVQAPAPTLPPVGLLDQNVYIHEHSLTLITLALKMEAANTAHVHTVDRMKSRINMNNEPL
jgi:hypothetical protein